MAVSVIATIVPDDLTLGASDFRMPNRELVHEMIDIKKRSGAIRDRDAEHGVRSEQIPVEARSGDIPRRSGCREPART